MRELILERVRDAIETFYDKEPDEFCRILGEFSFPTSSDWRTQISALPNSELLRLYDLVQQATRDRD